jgi:hypothetical protein
MGPAKVDFYVSLLRVKVLHLEGLDNDSVDFDA